MDVATEIFMCVMLVWAAGVGLTMAYFRAMDVADRGAYRLSSDDVACAALWFIALPIALIVLAFEWARSR